MVAKESRSRASRPRGRWPGHWPMSCRARAMRPTSCWSEPGWTRGVVARVSGHDGGGGGHGQARRAGCPFLLWQTTECCPWKSAVDGEDDRLDERSSVELRKPLPLVLSPQPRHKLPSTTDHLSRRSFRSTFIALWRASSCFSHADIKGLHCVIYSHHPRRRPPA